ncbi:hypothetical protein FEI15_01380 [Lacticaseibacillus zeae]|uniref:Uncharacterized protein n=1 Tax=Lacticaseibacillus zeae TaxID=57037 RepID=A0A5R8M103_LACZE|nr:hypothetical protein [Lacticaseibacillus zeae]TLF41889.1 hypothetical protein FEI15_01380 [Lacticaseibacillus zeae]
MDWFMRSDLALKLGIVLYVVFEILAIPIVSVLTVHRKISNVMRGVTIFLSFILAVAVPILVMTPLDSEYLHVSEKNFQLYGATLFFVLTFIPFILTLSVDLLMLYRLRDPQAKGHDQIDYFKAGSGIVFLIQGLLLYAGTTLLNVLAGLYSLIEFPSNLRPLSLIPVLAALVIVPIIIVKLWKRMMLLIERVSEYSKA